MNQRLHIDPGCRELLRTAGLQSLLDFFDDSVGEALTKPGLDRWRQRVQLTLGGEHVAYLKRYLRQPLSLQLRRILARRAGHSSAWCEWQVLRRLAAAGVPSMKALAFGEEMHGWWERRSFILLDSVAGDALERWLPTGWPSLSPRRRHAWVRQLAALVATMHRAGWCHRDLYLAHVFVDPADLENPAFCLIDVQRVFSPRWRPRRWQVKDLAQLSYSAPAGLISRADRWRFLRAYLGRAAGDDEHRWARDVEHKARRIGRHDRRRQARHRTHPKNDPGQPVQTR